MNRLAASLFCLTTLLGVSTARAADPAGGPGWYQLLDDSPISVPFEGGSLIVVGGTPGFLVGVTAPGALRLRFERGIATPRGAEITAASSPANAAALTLEVHPEEVRALLRQPQSEPVSAPTAPTPPKKVSR